MKKIRTSLPASQKGWSDTVNYIICHAIPRRIFLLQVGNQINKEPSSVQSEFMDILNLTNVGRPTESMEDVKKRLMYASLGLVCTSRRRRLKIFIIPNCRRLIGLWDNDSKIVHLWPYTIRFTRINMY